MGSVCSAHLDIGLNRISSISSAMRMPFTTRGALRDEEETGMRKGSGEGQDPHNINSSGLDQRFDEL